MIDSILAQIFSNQWRVILIVSVLLLAATELGFRFGLRLHRANDEARKSQIGGIQTAVLGLLGLLIGFTFSMAVDRFESRRELVLAEANAIGTAYLRALLLPGFHREEVGNLLRRYLDARLDFHAAGADKAGQAAAESATAQLQDELWAHAVAAAQAAPNPITLSFISVLNEVIDLDAARLHAMRMRVPGPVWLLVLTVAVCGCGAVGYGAGVSGARSAFAACILPLLIAVVITLIADLARPYHGMIGIDQQSLLDLKAKLSK